MTRVVVGVDGSVLFSLPGYMAFRDLREARGAIRDLSPYVARWGARTPRDPEFLETWA